MQLQRKAVIQEIVEYLLFFLDRIGSERADELYVKAILQGGPIALHGLIVISFGPLEIIDLLRPVQARAHRDIVLGKDLRDLRGHEPEVGLQGEGHVTVVQAFGKDRQRLPVKISSGQQRLSAVEGKSHRIAPELPEPCHDLLDGLYAHHRRPDLGATAKSELRRKTKPRYQHYMERQPGKLSSHFIFFNG